MSDRKQKHQTRLSFSGNVSGDCMC